MSRILPDITQTPAAPVSTGSLVVINRRPDDFTRPRNLRFHEDGGKKFLSSREESKRFHYVQGGTPFVPKGQQPGVSRGSERMCENRPDMRGPVEAVSDAVDKVQALRRGLHSYRQKSHPRPFYVPQGGNQAGPRFGFYDRATGVLLAQCRGTLHHVMGEAEKFAKAQGLDLSDIYVKIGE